jgi:DNA-binding CsgD family transcriptional regulator/PAS domain-containing protein
MGSRREATGAFDDIIPDLYDALLRPQAWPGVLTRVADAAKIGSVHFLFADAGGLPLMSEMSTRVRPGTNELYRDYYGAIDSSRKLAQDLPVGKFLLCHRVHDEDFVRGDEFYNDYLIPSGFRYLAGVRVFRDDGHDAMFGFFKNVGTDPFDDREVRALQTLLPHLRRVAQMQHRLATLEASASPLSGALDRLASGVVIIDQGFRVGFVNRVAEDILRAGSGLLLCNHRLLASDTDVSKRLDRLIAEAAQCAAGGDPHKGGGGLAVPRPSGERPLLLVVVPLPAFSAGRLWRAEPAVAVFITDPEARPPAPAQRFADMFGLTPAEARLAAWLVAGDSLAEAADRFGLSKYTLRAQLRALMDKTGTNRQAALVRLLTAVAGH